MHRRQYPFPDLSAWPPDEELISRRELAALLQVTEETVKNWYRAGLMPDRVPVLTEGILKDKARFFWHVSELRVWAYLMVRVVFKRPAVPKGTGRPLEWIAGQDWVEKAPVEPDEQVPKSAGAPSKSIKPGRRSSKIPNRHLVLLARQEAQLSRLDRLEAEADLREVERIAEEPEEREPPPRHRVHRAELEPEPFASNVRPPARVGYWGR